MFSKFLFNVFCISVTGCGTLYAQQGISAGGGVASGSGGSSSYTAGQIDYSVKGSAGQMTEGLQQPYEILTLATDETDSVKNITLYPNPVKDILFVDFNSESFRNSGYVLYDAQGKLLKKGTFSVQKNEINLSTLSASVYIIQILRDNRVIKTFKIIKNQ